MKSQRRREQKQKDYLAVPGSCLNSLSLLTIQSWIMEEGEGAGVGVGRSKRRGRTEGG